MEQLKQKISDLHMRSCILREERIKFTNKDELDVMSDSIWWLYRYSIGYDEDYETLETLYKNALYLANHIENEFVPDSFILGMFFTVACAIFILMMVYLSM
jgi:hypothetical protein